MSIDGKKVSFNSTDKNIVDVADRAKIGIPAPCYRSQRSKGCCNACVIEINGEQKFACSTAPENGMEIILNRDDLIALRKERLIKYATGSVNDNSCGCSCSEDTGCC